MSPESKEGLPRVSEEVSIGETMTVQTFMGREGNVVGRLTDGRIILFNKDNPDLSRIGPGELVQVKVVYVAKNYIIVDPISLPKEGVDGLKDSLEALMMVEDWEMAVLAKSLLYVIERLDGLSRKPDVS